jgi:hypothetical protein
MTPEMNGLIYLIMWIILVVCDMILGKSYIDAYFDAGKVENKKKCVKQLFEVIVSVIAGSAFFVMLILRSIMEVG